MINKEQIKKLSKEQTKEIEELLKQRKIEIREEERLKRNKESIDKGLERLLKTCERLLELGVTKPKLASVLNNIVGKLSQTPTKEEK